MNNAQVAHLWAHQAKDRVKSDNMFVEGRKIYSYGYHHLLAEMHGDFALINSNGYSSTTVRHRQHVQRALLGVKTYWLVPDPSNPAAEENLQYLMNNVCDEIGAILSRGWSSFSDLQLAMRDYNTYLDAFDLTPLVEFIQLDPEFEADLHAISREKALKNEEREATKQAKRAIARAARALEYAEELELWDSNRNTRDIPSDLFPFDMVRIKKYDPKTLETSSGAEVPVDHVERVLRVHNARQPIEMQRVGHFRIDSVNGDMVRVGCHTISIAQVKKVLNARA